MTRTLLESIRNHLQNAPGIPARSVFMLEDDDSLDTSILINPNQGYSESETPVFHESFQILARSATFPAAQDLSWKLYGLIESYRPVDSDSHVYTLPNMTQPPSYIGKDDKGRCVFTFNFSYPTTRKDYIR